MFLKLSFKRWKDKDNVLPPVYFLSEQMPVATSSSQDRALHPEWWQGPAPLSRLPLPGQPCAQGAGTGAQQRGLQLVLCCDIQRHRERLVET